MKSIVTLSLIKLIVDVYFFSSRQKSQRQKSRSKNGAKKAGVK
jgi:hypothetical protein